LNRFLAILEVHTKARQILDSGMLQQRHQDPSDFQGGTMAKVIIHLGETEHNALQQLAEREYRTVTAQTALMVRRQLQNLNLIPCDDGFNDQRELISRTKASLEA